MRRPPLLVALAAAVWAAAAFRPPPAADGMDLSAAAQLPVLHAGRVKPLDTVARSTLLMLRGRQSLRHERRPLTSLEWLLDAAARPELADSYPCFLIVEPEALGLLRKGPEAGKVLSYRELEPFLGEIAAQGERARAVEPQARDRFQAAVLNLYARLAAYQGVQSLLRELAEQTPEWAGLLEAWRSRDAAAFDAAVAALAQAARSAAPREASRARAEALFQRGAPFYLGMVLYLAAFLLASASWLGRRELLGRSSLALACVAFALHSGGILWRMLLEGRPPVTNLYSSAVFVGWVAAGLGLWVERSAKDGVGSALASACGFATLIIAHHLSVQGDTLEVMRAVLDSNFWLATHVVTITAGYGGAFLAGALAHVYILGGLLTRSLDRAAGSRLARMTYGLVCFSLFFSFLGTVLGGIWADQSWGRFWGWDPKENGALLIVLWNALILHARWGGYARERGLMAMAVFGNVVTALSWFGVNMLGIGLHSYGFMDKAFLWLAAFTASQMAVLALAFLPTRFRRSELLDAPA